MATFGLEEEVENHQPYQRNRSRFAERWFGTAWNECAESMRTIWDEIATEFADRGRCRASCERLGPTRIRAGERRGVLMPHARRLEARLASRTTICRTPIHYDLLQHGILRRLLERVSHVTLVKCRARLGVFLAKVFPLLTIDLVCVPPAWSDLVVTGYAFKRSAYKLRDAILASIDRPEGSSLVLVGAGFVGQWLTLRLK